MKVEVITLLGAAASVQAFPWMAAQMREEERGFLGDMFQNIGAGLGLDNLQSDFTKMLGGSNGRGIVSQFTTMANTLNNIQPGKMNNLFAEIRNGMAEVGNVSVPQGGAIFNKDWGSLTEEDIQYTFNLDRNNNDCGCDEPERLGYGIWGIGEDEAHPWQAPGPGDQRGPCPGLNTLANHGYIPRNGLVNPVQLFVGTWRGLSISPDVGAVLAVLSWPFMGDLTTMKLSIGTRVGLGDGLAHHGILEGDASVTRDDAWQGNQWSLSQDRWNQFKQEIITHGNGHVTLKALAEARYRAWKWSYDNNPQFDFNPWRMLVAYGESGFVYQALRGDAREYTVDMVESWFVHERFPKGWGRRTVPVSVPELLAWAAVIEVIKPAVPGWRLFGMWIGLPNFHTLSTFFKGVPGATAGSTLKDTGCNVANGVLTWVPSTFSNLIGGLNLGQLNGMSC